ncbi:hypothetical protein P3T76_010546 [Phytophthora citrophthora]|uniref:Uncharacterized protein n=1 Tax=Phytophthora citrophthora TaxID=4793 RepID=A0AAD9GCH8_9STRA|nr:hypothetical protein P3T76_010546 [Phytophthora citrophthora]
MPCEATSDVPFDWVDPNPAPEGQQFLVGVPALAEDFRVGNHLANTYGGPCVLVSLESFTAEDIWELERVIPGFIERQMLVSRVESRDRQNLEAHMGSIDVNRELASILMHLPHQRLAERVYKTTGYLKQMAGAHRRLRLQVESQGNTSLVGTATAQNESEGLKRQWVFNCQYWRHEVLDARRAAADVEVHLNAESKSLASHYQDQIDTLESEKLVLEERLADSVRLLKARPTTTATDSWGFLEFLFEHGELNWSWARLRELLAQFQ